MYGRLKRRVDTGEEAALYISSRDFSMTPTRDLHGFARE